MTGLNYKIQEMAHRIRELREIENFTIAEMAMKTGVTEQEYIDCELGRSDLNFAFLYRCALAFGVDVGDIIEGSSPNLNSFTVTRRGEGQRIEEAHDMIYYNMAASFRNRIAEPLYVQAAYSAEAEKEDIKLTTHEGQECDIVIEGQLKVQVGEHISVLNPGDSIYYDSGTPHGMIAVGGQDCLFYAIVLNPTGAPIPELTPEKAVPGTALQEFPAENGRTRVWHRYADVEKDENGTPVKIAFKNTEKFNFAFDVIDAIADEVPNKLAMLHLDKDKNEHRFTFNDLKRASNRCANYFKSLGIKKGDRVLLVLKRHYQFWFSILALEKIGAIGIPAVAQLQEHDFEYRFNAAGIKAIICTADGDTAHQADLAAKNAPSLELKLIVNGTREGWHNFDEEYQMYSTHFHRTDDTPCGDDLMLMYFTSGTTGYPKIAAHSYKHPLGHLHTAKYWHCVNPNGLHLTISDTGWAKAGWGKIYGQWLCEAAIFVYDFDRFDAADILPLFAKYHITTFCAPPTMWRMLIKQDLSKYDLSSVTHASSAGEALNPEVFRQIEKQTGLQVMEGFGQTESTMIIGNLAGADHKLGSMGKVVPIYKVALLDPEGKEVPVGTSGEICVDISNGIPIGLFREYYRDEEKTKEVMHDGWYHTGDVAWCDEDGFYWYVGRADDVIKSSGYRIGPFEIESVIMELPYVLECGVSAAPDEVRGQVVKASIVLTKGTEPTEELKKEIQNYVKQHTAPYKYPRIVVFRDELPKTVSGKIQRALL
ncbi:AMP-binding protein [Clostridiales bacterium FE2011]|nr:AMP-binding protein [Clostridiales bacterium FE2011]QTE75900.1 AMP-binding protein [Clostridiales bacterium FE2010]